MPPARQILCLAHHFPDLRMSLEHVGGYHFFNEAVAVIFNNIPFPPIAGRKHYCFRRPHQLPYARLSSLLVHALERLKELLLQVGPEQLIFGLDFPYNLEENIQIALRRLEQEIPDETQRALVLGGNLRAELGI